MTQDVPNNGRLIRNLGMACNYLMSNILHFYHLVALDYVDVNGTGLIPKGFLAPNYDSNYYARGIDPILQTGGLGAPAYTVNNAPNANPGIPTAALGDLTPYFAGQYIRALKFRRMSQQLGALFTGKMPQASSYTPGCVTVKPYDPTIGGADAAVVQKVHELLYGGPAFDPSAPGTNPVAGGTITLSNPHPESLLGFIGKPSNFWQWAANGFAPSDLPLWAVAGVPTAGSAWKAYTGTYLFDAVAAAHVFPEYFWFGAGYGRHLCWGIFEGADTMGFADKRAITRKRSHVNVCLNNGGAGHIRNMQFFEARHLDAREFTPYSSYDDTKGDTQGRHMWSNKQKAIPLTPGSGAPGKANAYTYAKSPRYDVVGNGNPNDFLPYEVGPLSRLMANASGLATPGGPATVPEVLAVNSGAAAAYYPGILNDVDKVLEGYLGIPSILPGNGIGVIPAFGTNLTAHLTFLQTAVGGSPVFYLPPNAVSPLAFTNGFKYDYYGSATLDRIAARCMETYFTAAQILSWFNQIDPNEKSNKTLHYDWGTGWKQKVPQKAKGAGLTEAPRGALGHWVQIGKGKNNPNWKAFKGKVSNYAIITPTTWNINPKDHLGNHGPAERCIIDTPLVNEAEPIEVLRVIHSFDFCCACTVHVMNAKKEKVAEVALEALP
jgi:Ni,Fe-hydrogenase I large subunit